MTVETERLLLYPVSNEEMITLINNEPAADMKQAYSEMLEGCLKSPEMRIWYAVWYMELKTQPGTIVGDFCFKGISSDGMVEIGYGLKPDYEGHGYMTEAVTAISKWALSQPGISRVEAETEITNTRSANVLFRAGFRLSGEQGAEGPRYVYCPNLILL